MTFLIVWIVGFILSFGLSRKIVMEEFEKNEDCFDFDGAGIILTVMFFCPLIPYFNLIYLLCLLIFLLVNFIDSLEVSQLAKKVFFIRGRKREKAKKTN